MNVSLIGPNSPQELERAITRARAAGVLVVAAAGNEATDAPRFPAAIPGTISVGASTYDGRRASLLQPRPVGEVRRARVRSDRRTRRWLGRRLRDVDVGAARGRDRRAHAHAGSLRVRRRHRGSARTYRPRSAWNAVRSPRRRRRVAPAREPGAAAAPEHPRERVLGIELEAFSGIWVGSGLRQSYQWERCRDGNCTAISGATRARYTPDGRRRRTPAASRHHGARGSARQHPRRRRSSRPGRGSRRLPTIVGRLASARSCVRCEDAGKEPISGSRSSGSAAGKRASESRGAATYRVRPRDRGYSLRIEVIASNSVGTVRAVSKLTRSGPIAPTRSRGSASRAPRSAPARPGGRPRARRAADLATPRSSAPSRPRGCPRSARRPDRAPRSRR